jgi:hypothetical protein
VTLPSLFAARPPALRGGTRLLGETLDVLVLSPVFKTGVGCEEHPGQVRFLCVSANI